MHTDSTFHWFYALNFRQTPVIIEISRTLKSTQVPHTYSVTQPKIGCVFVKMWSVKNHVHTHGLDNSLVV